MLLLLRAPRITQQSLASSLETGARHQTAGVFVVVWLGRLTIRKGLALNNLRLTRHLRVPNRSKLSSLIAWIDRCSCIARPGRRWAQARGARLQTTALKPTADLAQLVLAVDCAHRKAAVALHAAPNHQAVPRLKNVQSHDLACRCRCKLGAVPKDVVGTMGRCNRTVQPRQVENAAGALVGTALPRANNWMPFARTAPSIHTPSPAHPAAAGS